MKQILGSGLARAFQALKIKAERKYKNPRFEVWELSEAEYKRLCNVPDEDWKDEAFGWWRWGECILEGSPLYSFTVNGRKMLGWLDDKAIADLNKGEDPEDMVDETYYTGEKYESFTDWLLSVMRLSAERHIACFAISLAKENGLTLAEFMKQYQP